MEYKIQVDQKDHAFRGQENLDKFRKEGRFCDFIIRVESEELHVHQNVICSHSSFFDKMLTHDTQEKQTGVVELKGVDRECTIKCVDFMYGGKTSIEEDKCVDLMHAATMFQLIPLCDAIADLLVRNLDCKSFFATKNLADLFNNQKLVDMCNGFALEQYPGIAQMEEFGQLDEEYLKFLMESDNLKASEGRKCKSLVNWVKHEAQARKASLPGLMAKLDLTKVPLSYRSYITECESVIYSSAECMKLLTMSVFHGMNVKSKDLSMESKEGICIFDQNSSRLQVLDVDAGTWTTKQAFDNNILTNNFSAVILDDYLYVFTWNKTVYRIAHSDPDAKWEKRADKQLYRGPAVIFNGCIYTSDYENYSLRIERYDANDDKWHFLPNKQLNVFGAPLAISGGKLFCFAGCNTNNRYCAEVEMYDPSTSTWKYDNPLNTARYNSSAVTHEEGIYVLGGCGNNHQPLANVEYRCPSSSLWTTLKPMNKPRQLSGACCLNGKIFAVGGHNDNPQTIEAYHPETKEWKIVDQMHGKTVVALGSIITPV